MSGAVPDRWGGLVAAGRAPAIQLFDEAVDQLVRLTGDPARSAELAAAADGELVLARVLEAYLALYSTGAAGVDTARKLLVELDPASAAAGERELLHLRAAHAWAGGELERAVGSLERALLHDPRDLLALKVAQDLHFFLGDRKGLHDVVGRVLPSWPAHRPGWGYVQGMYAFGLEENGRYAQAEVRARDALRDDPGDVWAAHALAHVFEMTGRQHEGIDFLVASTGDWAESYFAIHNWWHRALYHLELGEVAEVVDLYDGPIRAGRSSEWLDVVDAASLLWRLSLFGVDLGDRARELLCDVEPLLDRPVYVFNDWHAVMAAGLAGRADLCDELLAANAQRAVATNRRAADAAGLDLLAGFAAFAREDWTRAVERLVHVRQRAHAVGGSHAQRDVIDLTLLAAAARQGDASLVAALVAERLARRPSAWAAARRLVDVHGG